LLLFLLYLLYSVFRIVDNWA